jgi:hypothetical protein
MSAFGVGMLAVLPGSEGASVTGTACPSDSIIGKMGKTEVNLKLNAPVADLPVKSTWSSDDWDPERTNGIARASRPRISGRRRVGCVPASHLPGDE